MDPYVFRFPELGIFPPVLTVLKRGSNGWVLEPIPGLLVYGGTSQVYGA